MPFEFLLGVLLLVDHAPVDHAWADPPDFSWRPAATELRTPTGHVIRLVNDNKGLAVVNNLLSGPPMRVETKSVVRFEGNIVCAGTKWFKDLTKGDLHLNGNLPKEVAQVASFA